MIREREIQITPPQTGRMEWIILGLKYIFFDGTGKN
jgi:hypothetical protein